MFINTRFYTKYYTSYFIQVRTSIGTSDVRTSESTSSGQKFRINYTGTYRHYSYLYKNNMVFVITDLERCSIVVGGGGVVVVLMVVVVVSV